MSSVLDTLTDEQRAEVLEAVQYRHLERMLAEYGVSRMLEQMLVRTVAVPSPAAGADVSVSVPAGSTWEPVSLAGTFTASAAVANRTQALIFTDGASVISRVRLSTTVTAGTVAKRALFLGAGYTAGGLGDPAIHDSMPQAVLPAAATITTSTVNIDTGDAWTAISLSVREWNAARVVNAIRYLLGDLDSAGGIRYLS